MRVHLILPFIGFLLKKVFSGVFKIHRKYRETMEDSPGLGVFAGTICSTGFVMFTSLISMISFQEITPIKYTFVVSVVVSLSYVCYMFFSMQFKNFLDERKELFDIIKDQ